MTRMLIIVLFVVAAALLGETQSSNAQSAYSYPWCAVYLSGGNIGGGARSCYYTSWKQCMATIFAIGGYCIESPYYHAPTQLPHHANAKPHHRRHDSSRAD
jgi:hypothetical protein